MSGQGILANKIASKMAAIAGKKSVVETAGEGYRPDEPHASAMTPATPGLKAVAPYTAFPVKCLPQELQDLVSHGAEAIGCDPAMIALGALTATSAAIGSTRRVEVKRGWLEPPFVSSACIADSGSKKTPCFKLACEDVAEDINDRLDTEYDWLRAAFEERERDWEQSRKRGVDSSSRGRPPVPRRFSVADITLETLIGKLGDNPRGMLVCRDELDGWLKSFTRYASKGGSDLPSWLSLMNAGTVNYSRKTGPKNEVRVRGVGVAVTGTIQPGVMRDAMRPEFMSAGLFARVVVAMPPPPRRVWTDAEVPDDVVNRYGDPVKGLFKLDFAGKSESGKPLPLVVSLSPEARRLFIDFYNQNGEVIETADGNEAAARSKLEGYAARFALNFHCCRAAGPDEVISEADMFSGIFLAEWFINEANRVYRLLAEGQEDAELRDLHEKLSRLAKRYGRLTPRDLHKSNRSRWDSTAAAEACLESLVTAGLWAVEETTPGHGRPTRHYAPRSPTGDLPR